MIILQGLPKMDMLGESDPFVKVFFIKIIVYYSFENKLFAWDNLLWRCSSCLIVEKASALLLKGGRSANLTKKKLAMTNGRAGF